MMVYSQIITVIILETLTFQLELKHTFNTHYMQKLICLTKVCIQYRVFKKTLEIFISRNEDNVKSESSVIKDVTA